MANTVLIYDATNTELTRLGTRYAKENPVTALGLHSFFQLDAAFARLKNIGTLVDRMMFYTHGQDSGFKLGADWISTHTIRRLIGKGFDSIFAPGATIFFNGCEVAEGREGLHFMRVVATTLLKRGGRVGGYDTKGIGFQYWGTQIFHPFAEACYASIKPGGKRARLQCGPALTSPVGEWIVQLGPLDHMDPEMRIYQFSQQNSVTYDFPNGALARGTWTLGRDELKIAWEWGGSDIWDAPLFGGCQSGVHGVDIDVLARRARHQTDALTRRPPM